MVGVMARLLPDMIDSTPERFTVVNESIGFLETTIGVGVMTADMQARRAEIISEVLIHMFEPTGPAQMAGVPEMIAGNIERMKSLSGPVTGEGSATSCWSQLVSTRTVLKVIARLYPTTPDDGTACPFDTSALQIILQRAHCYIDRRRFTSDKHAFITNGYRLLIALAAPEMMHPFLFKSVLQMLLKAMKAKEMCADAGGMFCYMHLVAQRHATRLVASTITSTAPALAQLVLDYITAGHAQCAEAMERVLERVCVIARSIDQRTVQLAILQLDADMPIARRLAHRFAVDFRTADPSVVMQLMDLRDSTPFAQLARVKYLRTALDQNGLAAQLGAASGGADVNHLVGRLLAMLDTSAGNRPLIVEIGHCLGKLACFLTGRIARVDSKSELALVAAATAGDDAVKPDVGHCVALSCLQRYLFHEEFEKVDQVIRCLKRILATPAGGVAFASLRPEVAQYLDICHDSVSEVVDESSRASYPKITDNALWEALQHRSDADPTTRTVSAEQALVNLANAILSSCPTDDIFPHLRSVFEMIPELGSTMMPYILHAALHHEMTVTRKTIRKRGVVSFRAMLSKRIREIVEAPEGVEEDVLVAILRVLEFLRTQPHPLSVTPFDNNAWLDLDFVNVAKAAVHCKSYASAVLFLEIAQEVSKRPWAKELNMTQTSSGGELTACDLLFSITRSIGDADGFDGVMSYGGSRSLGDGSTSLIQKYEHDRAWDKILNLREIQLKVGAFDTPAVRAGTQVGLMKAMSNLGLHHVLATYIGGVQRAAGDKGPLDHDIRELHYESMWRNAQWGDVAGHAQGDVGIQQRLYGIMKAVHDHDAPAVEFSVSSAFYDHLKINTGNTIRSDFNPFHPLRLLVSFVEAEEVWRMASAGSASAPLELFEIWETRLENLRKTQNLADLDPILACRTTALNGIVGSGSARSTNAKAGGIMGVRPGLVRAHCSHLLSVSKIARKARNAQMAQTAMAQLEIILNEDKMKPDASDLVDIFALAKLESLKILWEQGNSALTTRSLKHYIEVQMATETQQLSKKVESQLVCQLGRWTAATRYEPPVSVMHHLATAIDLAAAANDMKLLAKAHYHLAKFADDQYQEQLLNDTSDQLEEHIRYKEREAKACEDLTKRSVGKDASNAKRYTHIRDKILLQIEMDRAEVNRFRQDRDTFLEKAVANYAQALEHGKENLDMSVFRLISLWFANIQNKEINHIIKAASRAVPSSVFLVLLYQLSARLTTSPSDDEVAFQHNLQRILLKITRDHPYHSLYHIIALKNGGQLGAPSSSRRQEESTPTIKAAEAVLQRLRRPDHLGDLVVQVDRLCNAYIELAWRKPTAAQLKESKVQQLDARLNIYAIAKSGINVPIVTSDNPVRHDCRYDDLPTIQGFKGTFWIPGGVNMPKVLDCMGTDGKKYVQLVKGNDDLRQDAVLSNIFNIMNVLFKKDLETRQRNLGIRTYKVVPLAPRVGLVEWVSNTAPIGEFLVRAHSGYHPGDWKPNECRSRMMDEHKKGSTSSKLNLYRQIEANFKPVFRHFLFENFSDPLDWFERRLAYTRSVAASSIAGYVVGLGDRHAQNILIDKGTAEVIHIDLGIAFDQGKVLTVPELVPFRLTRDIVDGMGLLGVEGAFRRGCEETMKVLRKDSQALLTILDVFRYDPLVTWTLTPLEQRRRQGLAGSEEDDRLDVLESEGPNGTTAPNTRDRGQNKEAERALFVLRKKLSASVSVECQINELIQTAMDPKNLCRMFPGWQPWM
ncbi:uncharacterized protein EV422DRAFT_522547 [Fimicolochytrium jonesii]|uniref:uncharacterized protein n=1 Tax=Fimicolochytrium jonesii TaxID=1396493 RepID=UPI0022FEE1B7|nr:uncharacterized protein EV422DRAFT_522547 [Fimicolochytrium jonesii]KAI8822887.1 hypothetical protein EV422DRAFT_522547 [Fimicolochytrium jonesii]